MPSHPAYGTLDHRDLVRELHVQRTALGSKLRSRKGIRHGNPNCQDRIHIEAHCSDCDYLESFDQDCVDSKSLDQDSGQFKANGQEHSTAKRTSTARTRKRSDAPAELAAPGQRTAAGKAAPRDYRIGSTRRVSAGETAGSWPCCSVRSQDACTRSGADSTWPDVGIAVHLL